MKKETNKETELLVAIMKVRALTDKASTLSCFEGVDTYKRIAELQSTIQDMVVQLSRNTPGIDAESIYRVYEDIAKDAKGVYEMNVDQVVNNMETGTIQFQQYDMKEFLDLYVLKEESDGLFTHLFQFLDEETRVEYLKENFLCDLDIYFTPSLNYLVKFEVDDVVLKSQKDQYAA